MPKLSVTKGSLTGPLIPNVVFNTNDIVATSMTTDFMGIIMVGILEDDAVGVFRVDNTNLTVISSNNLFTTNPSIPNKYLLFFDSGVLKVQNKVGDSKTLKISILGLEQTAG
jgi:hypothetical protein